MTMTREEARRLYAQTLRGMNPDPELESRIDRYLKAESSAMLSPTAEQSASFLKHAATCEICGD